MQTILAFDYGTTKTGIAIGNTLSHQARSLQTITHEPLKPDFDEIAAIIQEWHPQQLLVGVPVGLDGEENDFCRSCRKFANRLNYQFVLPIILYDEAHSTVEAEESLKNGETEFGKKTMRFDNRKHRELRDQVAASIILQRYLSDLSIGKARPLV